MRGQKEPFLKSNSDGAQTDGEGGNLTASELLGTRSTRRKLDKRPKRRPSRKPSRRQRK